MEMNWQVTKNFITEKTDTVHNLGGEVFQNAKSTWSELGATETTNHAKETLLQAENMMKASVGDMFQKTDSFSQSLIDMVEVNINNRIDSWLHQYPIISWLVSHPVQGLIWLVIVIVLIFGLLQALGSLIKDAWLLILTSPFKLFRSSLQWSFQSILKSGKLSPTSSSLQPGLLSFSPFSSKSVSLEHQPRLAQIYQRLDDIRLEEHQLLEELKTIIGKP